MSSPPSWTTKYLGFPFELGSNGPERFDCWGLVRKVYLERFGIELPALLTMRSKQVDEQIDSAVCDWVEVETPKPGDVLTFRGIKNSIHVAIMVSKGWILHIKRGSFSCLNRYTEDPWRGTYLTAYRHKQLLDDQSQ